MILKSQKLTNFIKLTKFYNLTEEADTTRFACLAL